MDEKIAEKYLVLVTFLPLTPPCNFPLLFEKWGTMSKFEYILIPDVEEGPNILTAVSP